MEQFGTTGDGESVYRVTITGGGLTTSVISWGAVIQDLRLEGHEPPLVLGFERFEDYQAHSPYFGAIAGRYANRIRDGRFEIDGRSYQVDTNFLGKHLLHGGAHGIGKRNWQIAGTSENSVKLTLRDPDGVMGFPGNLDVSCTYSLEQNGTLCVILEAETDAPTLCNLAHHSYFNLEDGGSGDILDHTVKIAADRYLPVDEELIPTGEVPNVAGTAFDFQSPRAIGLPVDGPPVDYDHNFCLSEDRTELRDVAWIEAPRSGVSMGIATTEPGLQFYSGSKVAREVPGLGGRVYRAFAGFAMEPQVWPDAPNNPGFPQAILRPGENYRQVSEFRFSGTS